MDDGHSNQSVSLRGLAGSSRQPTEDRQSPPRPPTAFTTASCPLNLRIWRAVWTSHRNTCHGAWATQHASGQRIDDMHKSLGQVMQPMCHTACELLRSTEPGIGHRATMDTHLLVTTTRGKLGVVRRDGCIPHVVAMADVRLDPCAGVRVPENNIVVL